MSNKIARIQKYLKKLHNKQCNTITSIMHDISIQIQNNRTIIESNHKDKKYLEQLGNLYELDIKLSSIIDKNVMNVMTKPILNQNDLELIGAIESYRNDISQIISTLKQSYGHAEKTKDSNLEEVIRREEKKIIGYKIIIKNNKKKLANIDNEIYKITKSEEDVLNDEIVRIINKMEDENNKLAESMYLEYETKMKLEDKLKNLQEKYNVIFEKYKIAKNQNVGVNKSVKSSLDTKKEIQTKYNKDSYLLNNQLDGIKKDKEDLTNLINSTGVINKVRLERRMQQLIEEADYIKAQKTELYETYLDSIEQFKSIGSTPYFVRLKREMESINNNIKSIKYEMTSFSSKYVNPIYDDYVSRLLKLVDQFNNAKSRRSKVDERNDDLRNETIDICNKMINLYANKIILSNDYKKSLTETINEEDNNISVRAKDILWFNNSINTILGHINDYLKVRVEINSLN